VSSHGRAWDGAAAREALPSVAMILTATQAGLFAAELEARGFLAGVGKFILIVIIVLVLGGALIGFSVARRFGRRR
jgi:hypothetical protein